jgi:hypothetical protein
VTTIWTENVNPLRAVTINSNPHPATTPEVRKRIGASGTFQAVTALARCDYVTLAYQIYETAPTDSTYNTGY